MDTLQAVNQLKTLLIARKFNGDPTAKPVFGSVIISQALTKDAYPLLKFPFVMIRIGSSGNDDEEPAWITQQVNILLGVNVEGDAMGQNAMIGANVEAKSPQGRGLLEIQRDLLAVARFLNDVVGIRVVSRGKSSVAVTEDEDFGTINSREYAFDLKCTDYPELFSISGNVGISGVTVTAGGISTTSGVGGAYTITGLDSGTYTVTPALSGYVFNPLTQSVTVGTSDVTGVNFTYTIPHSSPSLTDLISWWKGQDNATDSKDSNNGTVGSAITYSTGVVGKAFNFGSTINDIITVADNSNLNPTDVITMGAFVKIKAFNPNGNVIFAKGTPPALINQQYLLKITSSGLVELDFDCGSPSNTNGGVTSIPLSLNTWYYIAGVINTTTNNYAIYVFDTSGNLIDSKLSTTVGGAMQPVSDPLMIGGTPAGTYSTQRLNGYLDEAVIYHRVLSQSEIQQLSIPSNY